LTPNGLEISRLAGEGRAARAATSYQDSVRSANDQIQREDTPAARLESITCRWQRDPAGQVGSIEWLGGSDYAPRCALGLSADIQVA